MTVQTLDIFHFLRRQAGTPFIMPSSAQVIPLSCRNSGWIWYSVSPDNWHELTCTTLHCTSNFIIPCSTGFSLSLSLPLSLSSLPTPYHLPHHPTSLIEWGRWVGGGRYLAEAVCLAFLLLQIQICVPCGFLLLIQTK